MSSETVFEYRHKKFDQAKRKREDNLFSTENESNSILLDLSDSSSRTSNSSKAISNFKPQRRNTKSVQYVTQSRFFKSTDNELRQRLQRVNLNSHIRPASFSSKDTNFPLNLDPLTASDNKRIVIKTELIEPVKNETTLSAIISECSPPKRRRTQSSSTTTTTTTIKSEPQSSPDIKIKEELIELNAQLPVIPREAYEDICKFRSNMVRKFPKKERSVKEQERRDKNTYACRKSRRVKKIEQVAVEEEYKNFKDANLRMAEYAIRAAAYFKELMKMSAEATASEVIVVD